MRLPITAFPELYSIEVPPAVPASEQVAEPIRLPVTAFPELYSIEIPVPPVVAQPEPIRLPVTAFPDLYSIQIPVPPEVSQLEPIRLPVTAFPDLYSIEIPVPPVVAQPEPIRLPVTAFPDLYSIQIPVPPEVSQPEPVAEPIRLPVTAVPELYQIAVPEKLLDRQSRIPRQKLVDADVMLCPGCGLSHSADLAGRQFTCRCGQQFPDAALGVLDELMQYNLVPFQPIAIDRTGAVPGPDLRMFTVPAVSGSFDQATANAVAIVSGDVAKDVSSADAMVRGWTWRQWGLGVLATGALSLTAVALLWDRHAGTVASTEQGYRIPLMAAEPLRVDPIRSVEDKRVVGADAKSGKEALVAWSPELDSTAVPAVVPVGVIETAVESIESSSEIEQANIEKANADSGGLLSQDLLAVPLSLAKGFEQQELLSEIALRQFAESVTALGERQAELKLSDLLWLADRWESYAQRAETHELAARCYWQAAAAMAMSREVAGSGVAEVASYQQRQELLTQKSHAETRMVSAEQGLRR
ncbi:hypothetical protein [Planctomycetes bacterium SV_7m_r]|uniref:hypothetical protein n=1 Tax=Stieleria bergensis TaxID=2528025 RepID=UPI0011AA2D61